MDQRLNCMQDLLTTIDKYVNKKEHRSHALLMLCDFIRHDPPHLHQLLQTPLFISLLRCLQIDTSTPVVSLALTAVVMILPHIPNAVVTHLPALFNIYSRLLFWDRERNNSTNDFVITSNRLGDPEKLSPEDAESQYGHDSNWEKIVYAEADGDNVPELLHFFTFLYGLYPINFMSYIRKPSRYLRHANILDADDLDIQPTEIRQRSEPFRQVHLLHPNFFSMTLEQEVNDRNRWMRSEAPDVVAACMALFASPGSLIQQAESMITSVQNGIDTSIVSLSEDSRPPLLQDDDVPPLNSLQQDDLILGSLRSSFDPSWRNTTSTIVVSPDGEGIHDLSEEGRLDSPTLPPVASPDSGQQGKTVDHLTMLQREVMMLKNDLVFERYLKQQHLSHIGQLRTKFVRHATAEAETQNLLNANRGLRNKLEDARNSTLQIRKDSEKSRSHAKKWEADLMAKLRALREQQKKWSTERETLDRDLATAHDEIYRMRQLIVVTESKELQSQQKLQSIEANMGELERLRVEAERLGNVVRMYESQEAKNQLAISNEALAISRVEVLELKLKSQTEEAERARQANVKQIESLRHQVENIHIEVQEKEAKGFQAMIDSALAASRSRLSEAQKAHAHLLKRFTQLEGMYFAVSETRQSSEITDEPLLGDETSRYEEDHRSGTPSPDERRSRHINMPDEDLMSLGGPVNPTSVMRPRVDVSQRLQSATSGNEVRSPIQRLARSDHSRNGSMDSDHGSDLDQLGKQKIQPSSEIRVYGRGL
jgi:solute carrier family 25 protein 16